MNIDMITMRKLIAFLILSSLEGITAFIFLLKIPADPKNAVFLGFSGFRLALFAISISVIIALLFLTFSTQSHFKKYQALIDRFLQSNRKYLFTSILFLLIFLLGWIIVWTPLYRFVGAASYFERLEPLVIWLTLFSGQTLIFLIHYRHPLRIELLRKIWKDHKKIFTTSIFIFFCFVLTWVLTRLTGWGIHPDSMFWNTSGVPILGLQILFASGIGIGVYWLDRSQIFKKNQLAIDIGICLLLGGIAAVLWITQPAQRSFFSPGPYPPNNEVYPFSDAAGYDIGAQFALIGQKFANGGYVDKPLYTFFLFLFHLVTGQNFSALVNLQTIILVLIPVSIYWMGKSYENRPAGAIAAVIMIFANLNAYQSSIWIQVVHTKMLMSEIPIALVMILFTKAIADWFRSGSLTMNSLISGGILGLSTLIRHNPWLFVPAIPILGLFQTQNPWGKRIKNIVLFLLAFSLSIIPWMVRSQLTVGTPWYFLVPFQGVIINNRYSPSVNPGNGNSLLPDFDQNAKTSAWADSLVANQNLPSETPEGITGKVALDLGKYGDAVTFVATHFFHNLITSIVTLPTSLVNHDIEHIVRAPDSFWDQDWVGQIKFSEIILILINLAILALGISSLWSRWKTAGIIPLIIFLGYNLATAVARTSGGRYIIPVEWVLYFYYAAGLIMLWGMVIKFLDRQQVNDGGEKNDNFLSPSTHIQLPKSSFGSAVPLIIIGVLALAIPTSDLLVPAQFTNNTISELASRLEKVDLKMGSQNVDINHFVNLPGAEILDGKALYPRFYYIGQGEPSTGSVYYARGYPRLVFEVIGNFGSRDVILPLSIPPDLFPNGSEVIVIGCAGANNLDALAVILYDANQTIVLQRSPSTPWICPLKEPVCDNNQVCQ